MYIRYRTIFFVIFNSEKVSSLLLKKLNSLHSATNFIKETELKNNFIFRCFDQKKL